MPPASNPDPASRRTRVIGLLWALVVIELISPFPLALTLGVAWVLATRPAWFLELVRTVYDGPSSDSVPER